MSRFLGSLVLAAGLAGSVAAQDHVTVVELFTSQGCSSCPPADGLFAELAARPDVIGLALHVDYWDYIGWADTFASPGFTERQRAYAHYAGENMVYTPQVIVNGAHRAVGTDRPVIEDMISRTDQTGRPTLRIERVGDALSVKAAPSAPLPHGAEVALVRFLPEAAVEIERGENAGRTVTYTNIVTSWQKVGTWSGTEPLDLTVDSPGTAGVVILLQEPGPGPILAAAALR